MAQKFGSSNKGAGSDDVVVVKSENVYESDRKMAADAISLMSNETDRSNTSAAQRSSHRNAGKCTFAFMVKYTKQKKICFFLP